MHEGKIPIKLNNLVLFKDETHCYYILNKMSSQVYRLSIENKKLYGRPISKVKINMSNLDLFNNDFVDIIQQKFNIEIVHHIEL